MTLTQIKPAGLSKPVDLADNEKIRLGTGNDLQIYHDGNSRIQNTNNSCDFRIQSDAIELKANSADEMILKGVKDGAVELYHNNSKKFETGSLGVRFFGDLFADDNEKIKLGNSQDLQIWHVDNGYSYINHAGGGYLMIQAANGFIIQNNSSENHIKGLNNAQVELYYDNSKKFETTSAGTEVSGNLVVGTVTLDGGGLSLSDNDKLKCGNGDDLQLYHDASGPISYIKNTTNGYLYIQDDVGQNIYIRATPNENAAVFKPNGAVELFYDNSKKLETTSTGSQGTGILKLISGNGSQSSDFSCLHIVAGGTADRGLKIGTGRATGASQNDGAVFYDAINSESNEYGSQHIFRRGGHNNMVIGYQSNNYVGIQQDAPGCALHVTDTNPVIAAFHRSNGSSSGDQARISLGALQNNPPYQRGVNLVAEYKNTGHDFIVQCSPNDSSGPAEKTRVLAGGGLTFNGDTAAANALDDYEEGTFTPSSAQVTLTGTISGHYTKIGDLVTVQCIMVVPTTTNTSDIEIDGLPFNAKNGTDGSYIQGGCVTYHNQGGGPYTVLLANNMNRLVVYQANGQRQTFNQFSGKNLRLMATYKVA